MKQYWKKGIVGIIMLAILIAPFSSGLKVNKVRAQITSDPNNLDLKLKTGEKLELSTPEKGIGYASAIFDIKATNLKLVYDGETSGYKVNTNIIDITAGEKDGGGSYSEGKSFGKDTVSSSSEKTIRICYGGNTTPDGKPCDSYESNTLKENNDYKLKITFDNYYPETGYSVIFNKIITETKNDPSVVYYWTFRTGDKTNNTSGTTTGDVKNYNQATDNDFGCSLIPMKLGGCVLQLFFILWQASAWVARLAGEFLDFFVYYATNSSSYTNTFVEQAWAGVRDIANIFFILALLFIAIKTVLGLNVTDNKKLIGAVVVVALFINFSLFTTKLVIDGSNILAKVFYNNISSVDEKGVNTEKNNVGGQKSISVGLVDKFNPQGVIMATYSDATLGIGYAIFVAILLIAITLYMAYVFFSIALLFVARVVSLWISMIFSPFAFASFTVPFKIPGFGHEEWWDDLSKNAVMAPIFAFLLYIIILFAGFLTDIARYADNQNLSGSANIMQHLMSIIIPFIILMALLNKAKKLTIEYAGEMGKTIVSGVKTIGGIAAGAAIGTTAAIGQGTLGHLGKGIFESKKLADWETNTDKGLGAWGKRFVGKNLRTASGAASTSSFDLRKGVGGVALKAASGLTGLNLGAQSKFLMKESGGYEADLKRRDEKRKKRAEGLKIKEGEPEKQHLNQVQEEHQKVSLENEKEIHEIEKEITAAEGKVKYLKDIAIASKGTPEGEANNDAYLAAGQKVKELKDKRSAIKSGGMLDENGNDGTGEFRTHNGNITKKAWEDANKEAEEAGKILVETGMVKSEAEKANAAAVTEKVAAIDELNAATAARIDAEAKANSKLTIGDPAVVAKTLEDAKKAEENAKNRMSVATNNVDTTLKTLENSNKKLEKAKEKISIAEKANIAKAYADTHKGFGNSQNEYEDKILPEAEHEVKHVNDRRTHGYANNIENQFAWPWNEAARRKSAHEIRMGVKAESHGSSKGSHLVTETVAASLAEKFVGGGKDHSSSHAPAAEKHDSGGKDAHGGGDSHAKH